LLLRSRLSEEISKIENYNIIENYHVFVLDVHEAFDHVLDEIEDAYHTKVDYPVAEFVIVFGFFVVLILEQIVLDCKEGWQQVAMFISDSKN
jgi:hypothetical protein